jgi:hypothetical protein
MHNAVPDADVIERADTEKWKPDGTPPDEGKYVKERCIV